MSTAILLLSLLCLAAPSALAGGDCSLPKVWCGGKCTSVKRCIKTPPRKLKIRSRDCPPGTKFEDRTRRDGYGKKAGRQQRCIIRKNSPHGPQLDWNAQGVLTAMGGYWNGKSHGLVRRWDIDGRETSAIGYDNQRAHGIYLNYFYKNGQFNGSRHLNKFQGRRAPRADLLERRR